MATTVRTSEPNPNADAATSTPAALAALCGRRDELNSQWQQASRRVQGLRAELTDVGAARIAVAAKLKPGLTPTERDVIHTSLDGLDRKAQRLDREMEVALQAEQQTKRDLDAINLQVCAAQQAEELEAKQREWQRLKAAARADAAKAEELRRQLYEAELVAERSSLREQNFAHLQRLEQEARRRGMRAT